MEERQKTHITKYFVTLVEYITCNEILMGSLLSEEILKWNDMDFVMKQAYESTKSKVLIELLTSRVGAYHKLVKALEYSRQSGAATILKRLDEAFPNYGIISVDTSDTKNFIGEGYSGSKVYKGTFDGRNVAVKMYTSNQQLQNQILKEVNFLRMLDDHENVVRYFLAEANGSSIYIALELCVINLDEQIQRKTYNVSQKDIVRKCASGLAHLHSNSILHGNLKPSNILINRLHQVKISDFGLSKEIPLEEMRFGLNDVTLFTAEWMAPEILNLCFAEKNKEQEVHKFTLTTSCDIFSLGCIIFYVMSNGSHPFGKIGDRQQNIRNGILKYLDFSPEERWVQSVTQMISSVPDHRPCIKSVLGDYCV